LLRVHRDAICDFDHGYLRSLWLRRDSADPTSTPRRLGSEAAQRMAAKLRPRVMLVGLVLSTSTRAAEARGRQLQRLVGRHPWGGRQLAEFQMSR
jgi:hypothetical protein